MIGAIIIAIVIVICLCGMGYGVYLMATCNPDTKGRVYYPGEYFQAEKIEGDYLNRALKVYKALDPEHTLISKDDDEDDEIEATITISNWASKGEKLTMSVLLNFYWDDEWSRMAIFPFDMMNIDTTNDEFIRSHVEMNENSRKHPGPGGHTWLVFKWKKDNCYV